MLYELVLFILPIRYCMVTILLDLIIFHIISNKIHQLMANYLIMKTLLQMEVTWVHPLRPQIGMLLQRK